MSLLIQEKKRIFQGKFLSVWATHFLDKSGKPQVWEWIKKKDIVVVFPITTDNKVILIKSYRVPLEREVIELPAGLVDKENENLEAAANRELTEETGFRAEKFFALPPTPYAAGSSNNLTYNFIATGLSKISNDRGDVTEDITVVEIPVNKLMNYYFSNPNMLFNIKIIAMYQIARAKGLVT